MLAGGALFGAGLMALARVLPSGDTGEASVVIVDRGRGIVLTPVVAAADDPTPSGAARIAASAADNVREVSVLNASPRVLALRFVDEGLRDRNGNAPKRAITAGELRMIASSYDVIADDLSGQPDGTPLAPEEIAAMHAINPGLRIVRVLETLTANDPAYAGLRPDDGTHSAWFLRDAGGEPALAYGGNAAWNGQANFVMDPANTDVQLAIAARARQYMLLGYDGVWLRGASSHLPAFAVPPAINPTTGAPYSNDDWRAATASLFAAVRRLAPGAAIYAASADVDIAIAAAAQITAASW